MREFETGATRDDDADKLDYEGFLSPPVLRRYAEYMHKHRTQADGTLRTSDNWQKGMPLGVYIKSGWRHFWDWWFMHRTAYRSKTNKDLLEEAICGLLFNLMGYLHVLLKKVSYADLETYEADGRINKGDPVVLTPEGKAKSARDAFEDRKIAEQQAQENTDTTPKPDFDKYRCCGYSAYREDD